MPTTPIQAIIDPSADSSLSAYVPSTQAIPAGISNANVYISTTQQYITNYVNVNNDVAGGETTQVQFNTNDQLTGDGGFTYNATTDTLTVAGNLNAGGLLTNNLYYANGTPWSFGTSSYSNSNVAAYLPTYTGNITANRVSATNFIGNGSLLTSIAGANVTGYVPTATAANTATTATSATSATTAGTVTTAAQPNITSVGSLVGLTVSNVSGVVNFTTTSNVTLGGVSNLHITGGTDGQVLTTNGSGNLSWTTVSSGSSFNGGTITDALFVSNATGSTNYNNGALKVTGGVGIGEHLHVLGHIASDATIYAGHLADFGSWVSPVFIGRDAGATYIQGALINTNELGSADWVAYNDSSPTDGSEGWTDMGYTGSNFSDPLYTITNANDGYVFVQGLGTTTGGNLVLATGELGLHHDLIFATGGFLEANEAMRLDHERNTFFVGGHAHTGLSDRIIDLDINGNIIIGGNLTPNANVTSNLGSSSNQFKNIYSANIILSGTGTAVDASQGNILTNKVTGTQFKFLHGSYSSTLQGNVSASSDITFTLPVSAGSSGQLLSTDGTGSLGWSNPPKDVPNFTIAYATFTCAIGKRYIVDTLTQVATTTLPTSPTLGQAIEFVDAFGSFDTYSLTINKSDANIMGDTSFVASIAGAHLTLVYNGQEWRVFNG